MKLPGLSDSKGFIDRGWLAVALSALAVAALGFHRRWVAEDAFITLRVVRHITMGNGPVFNAGERVEASTSTLWTWLLAAISYIAPFSLEWISVIAGLLFTVAGVILLAHFCMSLAEDSSSAAKSYFVPFGLLVLIGLPPFWDYTTSGLESGLCIAWLGACAVMLARQRLHYRWRLATVALLGSGPLVRPEFALYSGVFLLAFVVIGNVQWRELPKLILAAAILPALYQLFRMGYYAALVPNTALAKEASRFLPDRGLEFFWSLFGVYWLLLPLALTLIITGRQFLRHSDRNMRLLLLVLPLGGILNLAYIVAIGGDYMRGRLLLPAVVAIVAPASMLLVSFSQAQRYTTQCAGIVIVLAWACWSGLFAVAVPADANIFRFFDERAHMVTMSGRSNPVLIEDYEKSDSYVTAQQVSNSFGALNDVVAINGAFVNRQLPGKPGVGRVAVVSFIGVTGYALPLDVHVVDLLSLADPIGSRIALEQPGFVAGHEKPQPIEWVAARFSQPMDDESPQLQQARQRIVCPRVNTVLDAVQQPLSLQRFVKNILLSPQLTSMKLGSATELFSC